MNKILFFFSLLCTTCYGSEFQVLVSEGCYSYGDKHWIAPICYQSLSEADKQMRRHLAYEKWRSSFNHQKWSVVPEQEQQQ